MMNSMIWTLTADNGKVAWSTTLQGILMVFAVLALLWGAVEIMRATLAKNQQKGRGTPERKAAPAPKAPPAASAPQAPAAPQTDADGALVAAITAAIAATLAQEGYTGGFRVVSFKRSSGNHRRGRY